MFNQNYSPPFELEGAYEHVYDLLVAQRSLTVFPRGLFFLCCLNKNSYSYNKKYYKKIVTETKQKGHSSIPTLFLWVWYPLNWYHQM
jgi:hypothetical protein